MCAESLACYYLLAAMGNEASTLTLTAAAACESFLAHFHYLSFCSPVEGAGARVSVPIGLALVSVMVSPAD